MPMGVASIEGDADGGCCAGIVTEGLLDVWAAWAAR